MNRLPPPLNIDWHRRPLSSATTEILTLPDGRLKLWIEHETLKDVTPQMLVWWFQNLEGDMICQGQNLPRYRVWHPLDHIALTYVRRASDDTIGPGAVFRIQEVFARNSAWAVDTLTRVKKLDETGFIHVPTRFGLKVAHMEYLFEKVDGGTKYTNWLIAGIEAPLIGQLLNRLIRKFLFPDDKARAWLTHNVEEVGNLESFLPALYRSHTGDVHSSHECS